MKLKFTRKGKVDIKSTDAKTAQKIGDRLTTLSQNNRAEALTESRRLQPALPREPATPPGEGTPNLTLNSKRRTLTTSSAAANALALEAENEDTKRKWKARSFFGRHLTTLQCNNCTISRVCPKFKAGYECAYLPYLNSHKIETAGDLIRYMKQFAENSMRRAQLMSIQESASGGMPSLEASEALDMAFKQLKDLHTVITEENEESVELEGSHSLIGSIFGGMKAKKLLEETREMKRVDPIVDIPQTPVPQATAAELQAQDISAELIRDAVINQGNARKSLQMPATASIEQGELSHPHTK